MIRHVRSMELQYGEGFSALIQCFGKVMQYVNSHYEAQTLYLGMVAGDNRVVKFSTDFEDMAAYSKWETAFMVDEEYWKVVHETTGPYHHLIIGDTSELLHTM
jgi:hypothetical protein